MKLLLKNDGKLGRNKLRLSIDSHSNALFFFIISIPLFLLLHGCNGEEDQLVYARLQQWDTLLEYHPEAIRDSLQRVEIGRLSHANRTYYGLLKTITHDKTYMEFTSDSLINEIERYYSNHQHGSLLHIRSLIYHGIVNIRMDNTDSTAFTPLKRAQRLFVESKINDPYTGYLLHYYLGDLHYNHNNHAEAEHHYTKCLQFAKSDNKTKNIFEAYTALFWNEMTRENNETGKHYLDTLMSLKHISNEEVYNLLNMHSIYYENQGDFTRSLECEKQMLHLLPSIQYKVDEFRTLFSISDKYKNLNQLDSAMHYGLHAIQHIKDPTYKLNYLLYQNIADIALLKMNYMMAEEYRRKTFDIYRNNVDDQIDKRVLELEKLYNLTDAEKKALRSETNVKILSILSCMLLLLVSFVLFVYEKRKKITNLKKDKLKSEKRALESETQLLHCQTEEQKNIINIYSLFLQQYSDQQLQLNSFEMKIRGSRDDRSKLADDYKQLLKNGQKQFNHLSQQLFLTEIFKNLIELPPEQDFINEADYLLIIMLALKLDNPQIAAFLNTSLVNLKSKKSYLKKKLKEKISPADNLEQLLSLF